MTAPASTPFSQDYASLNPEQRQVVDTLSGPLMVLAGPGTGKTQVITLRIANLLQQTDLQPHNILALSFTQAAAKNMQQRLVGLIGTPGYSVKCTTFHSFAVDVIEANPEYFAVSPRLSTAVSDVDRLAIVEEAIAGNDFEYIKPVKTPLYSVRSVMDLISNYKREGHSPLSIQQLAQAARDELAERSDLSASARRTQEAIVNKNLEVAQVFSLYQAALAAKQSYDFEDMIIWVRDVFREHPEVLLQYQEQYQHILVDEWQDTNSSQLELVELLASAWGEQADLCVVGDPHQSIYRFQGASLSNTLRFLELYPGAQVVQLRTGYRCRQETYDAAARLIAHNEDGKTDSRLADLAAALRAHRGVGGANTLKSYEAPNTLAECFWVADEISRLIAAGQDPSEIAVLYRKHAHAHLLESVLVQVGVAYEKDSGGNVLDHPLVQRILLLFRFLLAMRTGVEGPLALPFLQQPWWKLAPLEILKVVREGSHSRAHHNNPWEFLLDDAAFEQLAGIDHNAWRLWRDKWIGWQQRESQLPLAAWWEEVMRESGLYTWVWRDGAALHDLNAVSSFGRSLIAWTQQHPTSHLEEFLARVERMRVHGFGIRGEDWQVRQRAVRLLSAHQAKGQEWDVVFLLHVHDTFWGNVRSPQKISPLPGTVPYFDSSAHQKNEDERRLFYVALTRSRGDVSVSWSQTATEGERTKELQPSQFVHELPMSALSLREVVDAEALREQLQRFVLAAPKHSALDIDREWLRSLLERFSLSASALNDYVKCPVGFVYQRLIRIPLVPSLALVQGTAAHGAMEFVYRELGATGRLPEPGAWQKVVERLLLNSNLPENEALNVAARTNSMLARFLDAQAGTMKPALAVEQSFGYSAPVVCSGLSLVGKVDRIDWVDQAAGTVALIDYKTGKPKSRNQILGQTKNSDGGYYRQIQFYGLLADLDPTFTHAATSAQFVFLEPTVAGKFKTETFELNVQTREPLLALLETVRSEWDSLAFLDLEPCGECSACEVLGLE